MSQEGLRPEGEGLRLALRWLSEQEEMSLAAIEQACVRFELSPKDEEFLIRQLLHHQDLSDG